MPTEDLAENVELSAVRNTRGMVPTADPGSLRYLWRPQLRDAKDEMVLETVANGRADVLVTFNLQDFKSAALRFGIHLKTPAHWLASWSSQRLDRLL